MSEGRRVLYKCRRQGRLFCLLLCVLAGLASQAQSPATTTVSDTVYRADGTNFQHRKWASCSLGNEERDSRDGRSVIGRACAQCRRRTSEHLLFRDVPTERRHREDRILVSRNDVSDQRCGSTDHASFGKFRGASGDEAVCRCGCRNQGKRHSGGSSQRR